ncbi:hypothetical protein BHM03_00056350, partial [Ensete ventricosum]
MLNMFLDSFVFGKTPYRLVCTVPQLTGTRTGRYRAVPPKGGRRRSTEEKSRKEEEEEEEEKKKEERRRRSEEEKVPRAVVARVPPPPSRRRRHRRPRARALSPLVDRLRVVAARAIFLPVRGEEIET